MELFMFFLLYALSFFSAPWLKVFAVRPPNVVDDNHNPIYDASPPHSPSSHDDQQIPSVRPSSQRKSHHRRTGSSSLSPFDISNLFSTSVTSEEEQQNLSQFAPSTDEQFAQPNEMGQIGHVRKGTSRRTRRPTSISQLDNIAKQLSDLANKDNNVETQASSSAAVVNPSESLFLNSHPINQINVPPPMEWQNRTMAPPPTAINIPAEVLDLDLMNLNVLPQNQKQNLATVPPNLVAQYPKTGAGRPRKKGNSSKQRENSQIIPKSHEIPKEYPKKPIKDWTEIQLPVHPEHVEPEKEVNVKEIDPKGTEEFEKIVEFVDDSGEWIKIEVTDKNGAVAKYLRDLFGNLPQMEKAPPELFFGGKRRYFTTNGTESVYPTIIIYSWIKLPLPVHPEHLKPGEEVNVKEIDSEATKEFEKIVEFMDDSGDWIKIEIRKDGGGAKYLRDLNGNPPEISKPPKQLFFAKNEQYFDSNGMLMTENTVKYLKENQKKMAKIEKIEKERKKKEAKMKKEERMEKRHNNLAQPQFYASPPTYYGRVPVDHFANYHQTQLPYQVIYSSAASTAQSQIPNYSRPPPSTHGPPIPLNYGPPIPPNYGSPVHLVSPQPHPTTYAFQTHTFPGCNTQSAAPSYHNYYQTNPPFNSPCFSYPPPRQMPFINSPNLGQMPNVAATSSAERSNNMLQQQNLGNDKPTKKSSKKKSKD